MSGRVTLVLTEPDLEALQRGEVQQLRLRTVIGGDDYTVIGHMTGDGGLTASVGPGGHLVVADDPLAVRGSVPHPDGTMKTVDVVRVVGERITMFVGDVSEDLATTFDRQVLALGVEGQRVLRRLHVGVVGASGTGSPVCEQLIRLGVGRITAIDPDVLTRTNITRVWNSTMYDEGVAKVVIVDRTANSIGIGTEVTAIQDTIASQEAARALRHCDVVFGCTDDNVGRLVLSRLAYIYLVPVVDMGIRIDTDDGRVIGIDGRITYMAPGSPCLKCQGWIDFDRLAAEELPEDERDDLVAEGYVVDLDEPDPSVITYTTAVAAHAVSDLLARLFGFGEVPNNRIIQFHTNAIRTPGQAAQVGCFCVDTNLRGAGDLDPFLDRPWAS